MSNYHRQASHKPAHNQGKGRRSINYLAHSIIFGLITSGSPLWLLPVFAAPTAPNVIIDNQATGTFADLDDTSTGTQSVVSNTVSVTVAEVAGITIVSSNIPNAIVGGVAEFEFKIQNIGNDPTKFFLPSTLSASQIVGGTQSGVLQIIGYVPAGSTTTTTLTTPIDVTTATNTGALSDPTLGGNTTLGSIPADASIVVRVKVSVTAAAGAAVAVILGDTTTTPLSNVPYVTGTNDVYTVDNTDGTITGEAAGISINGVREASANQSVLAISTGIDYGDAPSDLSSIDASLNPAYPTLVANNGASHNLDGVHYLGAGVGAETDGKPTFNADGDSQDDGVTFPTISSQSAIVVGQSNTITVSASAAGVLNAWIDWNQDGKWDPSEQIALNQALTPGNNTVTVNPPNTVPHGKTYARFRFSTQSNLQPTGAAIDGEVEDYAINVAIPEITQCTAPLLNGGLELPNISGSIPTPLQTYEPNIKAYREADIPGWANITNSPSAFEPATTVTQFNQRNSLEMWRTGNSLGVPAYQGQQFAEINSYAFGRLYQDIITTPGVSMRWQFAHRGRAGNDTIRVKIGSPGATTDQGSHTTGNTGWKVYTGSYTIPAGQTITRFEFEAVSSATGNPGQGNFIDDIQFGVDCSKSISGNVFEDPNYGGGAGRPLNTPTTVGRANARVEIYDATTGAFKGFTTTDSAGAYKFDANNVIGGVLAGNYKIRVVNSTVTSSRSGYVSTLIPVQTFRIDATTGSVINVTDHVGGEKPTEVDAAANTTSTNLATLDTPTQEAQSLTTVQVGTTDVTGIDFGYNFDTIVNTSNAGQGSLRQFITNSNALTNTNLAQEGQTAGQEVSIFMISDGSARAGLSGSYSTGINGNGGNSNTAVIALSSQMIISDSNTSIDGRTQTQNVFDTNSGTVGTGLTVGTDSLPLSVIPKPEIALDFSTMPIVNGNLNANGGGSNAIVVQGQNTTLAGFSFYGYRIQAGLGGMNKGAIWINPAVTDSGKATLTQLLGGTLADGSSPAANIYVGYAFQATGAADIFNNYFAYLADAGTFGNSTGIVSNAAINFYNNEVFANGPKNAGTDASGVYADQLETEINAKNIKIYQNLIHGATSAVSSLSQGKGLQISTGSSAEVTNNTFRGNYQAGIMSAGIDDIIEKNIITDSRVDGAGNYGSGIVVLKFDNNSGLRNKISQNSLYGNVKLGIDLGTYNGATFQAGVTGNDGATNTNNSGTQAGNIGMDYPIITSSTLSAGKLTVKGYVGISSVGNSLFANKVVELFVAADDGNNNGEVFLGDARSKPHGEGKTYIGNCTTDANGLFGVSPACEFTNAATLSLTNASNITATATDAAGNTSEFSATPSVKAQLLLVKRVTAIKDAETNAVTNFTTFTDDTTSPNKTDDNNCNWKNSTGTAGACTNTYTVGQITPPPVKPGDEVEYTIYYLNSGENRATQARVCDQLDASLDFQTQFDSTNSATLDKGIALVPGTSTPPQYLSNSGADTDAGRLTTPSLATSCNLAANSGTNLSNDVVVVDVGTASSPLMGSTSAGAPATSYGYIRFKVKVKK
jgi:uncharacterized repeat protein (TIGR01451 family)